MIADSTVQQVREYSDIVGVISEYVTLKKRGRNFIGLCPFHSEKTPSFTVSPEKQIFHCFGCHESGDLISFVQKVDSLTFVEAVTVIAQRAGIVVEETRGSASQYHTDFDTIRDMLALLLAKYQTFLAESGPTVSYLADRGVLKDSFEMFQLGFSPSSFDAASFLKKEGASDDIIDRTGVFYRTDQGQFRSRFSGRLIFPVLDYQRRVTGFGGRVMQSGNSDRSVAKYVNSQESRLFNKRKLLYGIGLAKPAIKKAGFAILMEGYMDVLMAHQFGFAHSVGVMGTALTKEQVQLIKRFTDTVYLAFDNDQAGQMAMQKSYQVLAPFGMTVKCLSMSEKDPADILLAHDADYFQGLIDQAVPVLDRLIETSVNALPNREIDTVSKCLGQLLDVVKLNPSKVVQDHYVGILAQELEIDREIILAQIRKTRYNVVSSLKFSKKDHTSKYLKAASFLAYVSATDQSYRESLRSKLEGIDFIDPDYVKLMGIIIGSDLYNQALYDEIEDDELKKKYGALLIEGEQVFTKVNVTQQIDECIGVLKEYYVSKRREEIKVAIREIEKTGKDTEQILMLLNELKELKSSREQLNYG